MALSAASRRRDGVEIPRKGVLVKKRSLLRLCYCYFHITEGIALQCNGMDIYQAGTRNS
jgi:hypothetical protein